MKHVDLKLSYQLPCGCHTREVTITSVYDDAFGYQRAVATGCSQLFAIVQQETNLLMTPPQSLTRN